MLKKAVDEAAKHAGVGFLSGQGIALAVSVYHAFRHAPYGTKATDAVDQFQRRSVNDGVKMAIWSIINGAVDPAMANLVPNEQVRSVLSGAVTGAVMTMRNGVKQAAMTALSGAMQSLTMNMLGSSVEVALKPIDEYQTARLSKKFWEGRNEAVFVPPADSLTSAFLKREV